MRNTLSQRKVSIPFKRESISKDIMENDEIEDEGEFQFPSNGKAYPKIEV